MEESDSDSMSSFDVSYSDNGTGNKDDDSNHKGDAGTGTIKLKCMFCGEAVDSIGELRLHMDTGEFHPNTSSKISFEKFLQFALKDYNNDCISKAEGQAQLLNEEATVEVDSVDSANNAEEMENGFSTDAMHPDSISTNADDDDEVEQVLLSTSAGIGKEKIILSPSQSAANHAENNDQEGDRGGQDLDAGDHDNDDDANDEKEYKCNICTNVFFYTRDSMRRHIMSVHVEEYVELQLRKATEGHREWNYKRQTQPLTPPTTPEVHLVFMLNNNDEIEIEVPVNIRVSNSTSSNAETEQPQPYTSAELGDQDQVPCTSVSSEVSTSSGETSSPTRQPPSTSSSSPRNRGELVLDMVPVSPPSPSHSSLLRKKRGKAIDKKVKNKPKITRFPIAIPDHITVIDGDPINYKCTPCEKQFKTKAHIKYHVYCQKEAGAGDKPFKCDLCRKRFIAKSHFEYHLRWHNGEKPYPCPKCGKRFNQKGKVTRHMMSHTGAKPFVCQECSKGFANRQALQSHTLIHTGERPFGCTYCNKRFTGQTNLNKHLRIHTGERAFSCSHCGKSFGTKWTLDMHVLTHSTERPYACDQCTQAFSSSKDLRRHLTIHTGEKPFKCTVCPAAFPRRDNLVRHHEKVHKESKEVAKKLASDAFAVHQQMRDATSQMKHEEMPTNSNSVNMSSNSYSDDSQPSTSAGVRATSKPQSEVPKKKNNSNKSRTGGNQSSTIVQPSTRMLPGTKRKQEEVPAPVAPPNCRKSKRLLDKKHCEDSSGGKKEATTPTKSESSPHLEIKEAAFTCSTFPSVDSSDPTLVLSKNKGPTLTLVNH